MEKVSVSTDALRRVLVALSSPPHHIRELTATMSIHELSPNPICILIEEFNAQVGKKGGA